MRPHLVVSWASPPVPWHQRFETNQRAPAARTIDNVRDRSMAKMRASACPLWRQVMSGPESSRHSHPRAFNLPAEYRKSSYVIWVIGAPAPICRKDTGDHEGVSATGLWAGPSTRGTAASSFAV